MVAAHGLWCYAGKAWVEQNETMKRSSQNKSKVSSKLLARKKRPVKVSPRLLASMKGSGTTLSVNSGMTPRWKAQEKAGQKATSKALATGKGHITWAHSLAEPAKFIGRKIPDHNVKQTAPLVVLEHGSFPAPNAANLTGAIFSFGNIVNSLQTHSAASTAGVFAYNAVSSPATNYSTFGTDYSSVRLVSAVVHWAVSSSLLNIAGNCVMSPFYENTGITTAAAQATSLSALVARQYHAKISLANQTEGSVCWIPSDSSSYDFRAGTFSGTTDGPGQDGCCHIIFSGVPSTAVIEYTVVRNYEGVPTEAKRASLMLSPGHHDPFDMAFSINMAQKIPKFNTTTTEDISRVSSQTVHQPYNPPTLFQKIMGGIDTAIGVVNTVAKSPIGELIGEGAKFIGSLL